LVMEQAPVAHAAGRVRASNRILYTRGNRWALVFDVRGQLSDLVLADIERLARAKEFARPPSFGARTLPALAGGADPAPRRPPAVGRHTARLVPAPSTSPSCRLRATRQESGQPTGTGLAACPIPTFLRYPGHWREMTSTGDAAGVDQSASVRRQEGEMVVGAGRAGPRRHSLPTTRRSRPRPGGPPWRGTRSRKVR